MQCESMRHREPCRLCQTDIGREVIRGLRAVSDGSGYKGGCRHPQYQCRGRQSRRRFAYGRPQGAIDGVLRIKGAPEKRQYFNLSAETIELDPVAESGIGGEMEFRGTLCKDIVTPTDKKGNRFLRFSAYSTDKIGDEFYSVFVRFVRFSEAMEPFLVPKGKIETKGELRITSFNGNLDFSCKIAELSEYKKLPF